MGTSTIANTHTRVHSIITSKTYQDEFNLYKYFIVIIICVTSCVPNINITQITYLK